MDPFFFPDSNLAVTELNALQCQGEKNCPQEKLSREQGSKGVGVRRKIKERRKISHIT